MSYSVLRDDHEPYSSGWVRSKFIKFFESKGHVYWPSSSVLPNEDPTLLFVNAGMNQFKDIISGKCDSSTDFGKLKRVCNSQKCIRAGGKHNDLDDVGYDNYHNTFFEMLGNWSFGDYFKSDAIAYAWELLVDVYGLNPENIYVTYFGGDDKIPSCPPDLESRDLWSRYLPADRILPFGMKDNFWEMADVGPCGPCTEIHYDHIGNRDASHLVNADDPNVLEIWNLVFMEYNRYKDGNMEFLPNKCVDTGMGLERICAILNGSNSNYDCDLFKDVISEIKKLAPNLPDYSSSNNKIDISYRVIADHARCLTIAISDGIYPSNDGRGYVLRRILRRAIRYINDYLNINTPFLYLLVNVVSGVLGDVYLNIKENKDEIRSIILDEEELFLKTLDKGCDKFNRLINKIKNVKNPIISGDDAFLLYSSYGFPLDLTVLMAKDYNIPVDVEGFLTRSKLHKLQSEKKAITTSSIDEVQFNELYNSLTPDKLDIITKLCKIPTDDQWKYDWESRDDFHATFQGKVLAIWTLDYGLVEGLKFDGGKIDVYSEGRIVGDSGDKKHHNHTISDNKPHDISKPFVFAIVTDKTPFYAEGGGQIYDQGLLDQFLVERVYKMSGLVFHFCSDNSLRVRSDGDVSSTISDLVTSPSSAFLSVWDLVNLSVDYSRRVKVACNHSCTHLLNFILRKLYDNSTYQRGSQLDDEKLKFDFASSSQLSDDTLTSIEEGIQSIIDGSYNLHTNIIPYSDISNIEGIRANFNEKYPPNVRVVHVGDDDGLSTSIEVCGGTHVSNTKDIKDVCIVCEEGISKGVRRLTLITHDKSLSSKKRLESYNERLNETINGLKDITNGELSQLAVNAEENMKRITALRVFVQDDRLLPIVGKKKLLNKFEDAIDDQMSVIKRNQKRLLGLVKNLSCKFTSQLQAGDYSDCTFVKIGQVPTVRFTVDELEGDLKVLNVFVQTMVKSFPDYAIFATSTTSASSCCKCTSPNSTVDAIKIANEIANELGIFPGEPNPAKGSATSAVWTKIKSPSEAT